MSIFSVLMTSAGVELGVRVKNKFTRYPGDLYWLQVSLYVNGDDLNDHSTLKNTCTVTGDTNYVTSTEKYGVGSISFPGTGSSFYVAAPTSTLLGLNSDFTVEFWCYLVPAYHNAGVIGCWNTNNFVGSQSWVISFDTQGKIYASIKTGDESTVLSTSHSAISVNVWQHIAFVRSGSTFTLYIDGNSVGSFFYAGNLAPGPNRLTMNGYDNGGNGFSGYLDDIRITTGVARYTANFKTPTETFQTTMTTSALSRFLIGDEVFAFGENEAYVGLISMGSPSDTLIL